MMLVLKPNCTSPPELCAVVDDQGWSEGCERTDPEVFDESLGSAIRESAALAHDLFALLSPSDQI